MEMSVYEVIVAGVNRGIGIRYNTVLLRHGPPVFQVD